MSKVEDEADAFDNKKRLWITTSDDTFAMALIVSSKGDQITVRNEATQEVCRPAQCPHSLTCFLPGAHRCRVDHVPGQPQEV